MTHDTTYARARLYFDRPPPLDFAALTTAIHKRAARFGIRCDLEWMPGGTTQDRLLLGGGGQHVLIEHIRASRPPASFARLLQSPFTRAKKYDFEAAIASQAAHIVIRVGEGDLPCRMLIRPDIARRTRLLHLVTQTIAASVRPTMAEFGPAGALLSPKDLLATEDLALPTPLLFHPRITLAGADTRDRAVLRVAAEASEALIGKKLILDRVPSRMNPAEMVNILTCLIDEYRAGDLGLADGDVIQLGDRHTLFVSRPSKGSISASFDRPPAPPVAPETVIGTDRPEPANKPPRRRVQTLAYVLIAALTLGAALNADGPTRERAEMNEHSAEALGSPQITQLDIRSGALSSEL